MPAPFLLGVLLLAGAQAPAGAAAPAAALSDGAKERVLLEGEIVSVRDAPGGVTGSLRVTLRHGGTTHEASVQSIDEAAPQKSLGSTFEVDFRDSYKNNVAAYRLDRMLGLGMVPVTVVRRHEDKEAAFTWWVDDVLMVERDRKQSGQSPPDTLAWNRQIYVLRAFDQLIFNFDRNLGNLVIDTQWRIWMIDHTRSFKIFKELRNKKELHETCESGLLAALKRLDKDALRARMRDLLSDGQIQGLLGRRDAIVEHYDGLIASRGRARVVYDLPRR